MTKEDESLIKQLIRIEIVRALGTIDCGVMEDTKPVTAKSRFVEILSDINHRKWAVVVEVASDALCRELIDSPEMLSATEHKRLESILLLDEAAPFRTAPRTCKEIGKLLLAAKKASTDAALHVVPPAKATSGEGRRRSEIFELEAERKRESDAAGALWEPLAENAWAFRRP
ncbi:MAG: hypothetical protein ACRD23_13610 [Terriglobales bacterium]